MTIKQKWIIFAATAAAFGVGSFGGLIVYNKIRMVQELQRLNGPRATATDVTISGAYTGMSGGCRCVGQS